MERILLCAVLYRYGTRTEMQDRGFIWRELTGHATQHDGVFVTDQTNRRQLTTNREHQDQDFEITSFWGTRDCACPPARGRCFCNNRVLAVHALDQACFLGPPSQQRSGTMTRTRSPSGGERAGEGPLAQPIDHLMLHLPGMLFFSAPLLPRY